MITPSHTYVSIQDDLYAYNHDLTGESLIHSPVYPRGNKGHLYDPLADRIVGVSTSFIHPTFAVYTGDFAALTLGPVQDSSVSSIQTGMIDGEGHLHLPRRSGSGIDEFDEDLVYLGSWGANVVDGIDMAYRDGLGYHMSGPGTVTVFDMDDPTRPVVSSFTIASFAKSITVDPYGTIYIVRGGRLMPYQLDGSLTTALALDPGTDARSVAYNEHNGTVVVGYQNGGQPFVRNHCPFNP